MRMMRCATCHMKSLNVMMGPAMNKGGYRTYARKFTRE